MDDPALDREGHARALRSLVRINRILGVDRSLYSAVRRFGDKASVLDLGAGSGGFLEYLASKGDGRLLLGLDISAFALQQIRLGNGDVARRSRLAVEESALLLGFVGVAQLPDLVNEALPANHAAPSRE